jgi:putative SOS response-associated peptidase YedK
MCYSAEAWALYDSYVREFGATVDMREFWILYLNRDEAFRTKRRASDIHKIPKGMDLAFLNPKSDMERDILRLIESWNTARVAEQEPKLFEQITRLNNAERKLAAKETKTALNEQRVAGNKIKQIKRWLADAKRTTLEPERDNRIFPDWYAPVLIVEDGKRVVRPMRYHCRPAGMDPSIDRTKDGRVSGTYNARRDNLTRFWRKQFGHTHALMMAETFYEQVDDGKGGSKEIHFRPSTGETMYVACLWSKWTDPNGVLPDLYSFAAVTDEPEPEVAAAGHDRTIINLKPENAEAWLTPQGRTTDELMALFDDKRHPYYELLKAA